MISPGLPGFPLVLDVGQERQWWQQCGEQINPSGSSQVSLIHLGVWLSQGRF